ncbi:MAG: FtsX-like permease family protein [Candidatus Latescibacteria bacterium]|nr:FtsX-like permease family protein [Candidatus Latescibacterota bacterium]
MSSLKSYLVLALAALMLLSVVVFDPAYLSIGIERLIGWQPVAQAAPSAAGAGEIEGLDAINSASLKSHLEQFTAYPSRVTGYEGAERAADYIADQFRLLGLQRVQSETFKVPVPMDRGGRIRLQVSGREFALFGLWPNHLRTPSLPEDGIQGHLIDAGQGAVAELDGQVVEGAVVLMGFGSGDRYIEARMLGAQAILFYDDGGTTRGQAADKFLQVPVDIPRFWIQADAAQVLLQEARQGPASVYLRARMDWQQVEARNILGYLGGTDEKMPLGQRQQDQVWKDQVIVLHAYYDAISVVPALAPGAENAAGIAALLEIARFLKERGTRYTVLFLATPGHFEGLAGINDFLYRHARQSSYFRERIDPEQLIDFRLFLGLDLSSQSSRVGAFTLGTFYNSAWATNDYQKNLMAHYATKFGAYNYELFGDSTRYQDAIAPSKRTWKNYMPVRLALDSEAVAFVGKEGLSFVTPNQLRERVDTPMDRLDQVDLEGLTQQTRTVAGLLVKAAGDADFFNDSKLGLRDWGHSLEGSIYWFDREVNFAVPKAPVAGAWVTYLQPGPNSVGGVRTLITTQAATEGEEKGHFKFNIMRNRFSNRIQAFELDAAGRIISAPDLGSEGDGTYPTLQAYGWWENRMLQVLFKCRALDFLEVVDPRYLSALDQIAVLGSNDAPPQSFGYNYIENQSAQEDRVVQAGVVFAEPGTRVKILAGESAFGSSGVLSNVRYLLSGADSTFLHQRLEPDQVDMATVERAQGAGYPVDQGTVFHPSYQAARDMWIVDEARIKQLGRYGIVLENIERMHEEARLALEEARQKLRALDYTGYLAATRKALGLEARIYPDVKSTANDTVRAVIFYFALLLPFAFFCERFFFGFAQIRQQIMAFAGIFVGIFLVLRWVHPAFKLSTSPYVIFLAFVILALGVLVIWIIVGRFKEFLMQRRRAASSMHETDVGRLSAGMAAVLLGISNLRKRKLRTGLTAVTLTLLTFTVSSFSSVKSQLDFYRLPRDNQPLYEGAMLRDRAWRGLQQSTLEYVESAFGDRALVVPRAWYLSQVQTEWAYIDFEAPSTGKQAFVNGLVGFRPEESQISGIDQHLVAGRFFTHDDRYACILPDKMAQLVGIAASDVGRADIELFGRSYRVVGILDSQALNAVRDLDGEQLTPVDTVNEAGKLSAEVTQDPRTQAATAIETLNHLAAENALYLPYDRVLEMEGRIRSIAVLQTGDSETFIETIEGFMSRVALTLFVSEGDRVVAYSSIGSTQVAGAGQLFIPVLIAALIVLNTMMGAVYERAPEIGIYSVVGLAPSHISLLFLAEATVFATFGAVAGYLLGQISYVFILQYELLGGLTLNYSSLSAVWATVIVIVTVYMSTLYPARMAANMAVPDVTRQWSFPDPEGDQWAFDFPFTVGGAEVPSMYVYLKSVFDAYGEGSIGDFIAQNVELRIDEDADEQIYEVSMMAWLAPYDLGISQAVSLRAVPTGEHNIYKVETLLQRRSGDVASWQRMNRNFLNVLRKRFLVWRTLPGGLRDEYRQRAEAEYALAKG